MSIGVAPADYVLNATGVWVPAAGPKDFGYSDGDSIETQIASIVRQSSDVSVGSLELQHAIVDFPSRYHLSPERANLLRPLSQMLRGTVIEVGAGCGALTRYLGEIGATVCALEGSFRRAAICRSRCRDLQQVEVFCSNLTSFQPCSRFDAVTLVGVLEYSRMYVGEMIGPAAMLRLCADLLRDHGVLVVAIENQLGLKYFAGAAEDHTGVPFFGIEDRYQPNTPVTFGRRELRELLTASGFPFHSFLYPFPDYKFPRVVFPSQALEAADVNVVSLLRMNGAGDLAVPAARVFSEEMAWSVVLRNGLAEDMANSFLVVASKTIESLSGFAPEVSVHTARRRKIHAKMTTFRVGKGPITRTNLYPETLHADGSQCAPETEPLYRGPLLGESFLIVLNQPGWTDYDLARCAQPWLGYLQSQAISAAADLIPGHLVDCTPFNIARLADGTLHPFDLEWTAAQPIPISFVLFRGLINLLFRITSIAKPGAIKSRLLIDIVCSVMRILGYPQTNEMLADLIEREAELHEDAGGTGEGVRRTYPKLTLPFARVENIGQELEARERQAVDAAAEVTSVLQELAETSISRDHLVEGAQELRRQIAAFEHERQSLIVRLQETDELRRQFAVLKHERESLAVRLEEVIGSRTWQWGSRIAKYFRWMK
jgi:SAM-dependent methyltransferase